MWHSGAGKSVTINEIMDEIQQHTDNGGGVFIGCDSQIVKNDCTFSSVICHHGATGQQGEIGRASCRERVCIYV